MSSRRGRPVPRWLEAHPDALRDAEESRRVWALLSAYADEPVPEGFAERVIARASGATSQAEARGGAVPASVASPLRLLSGGRRRALAAAAAVLVAVGAGALLLRDGGPRVSDVSLALEAVPAELLESDNLASLASLSDEEFEALLAADPETLAADSHRKNRGG